MNQPIPVQPRFRLVFTDPGDATPERPQQIFSPDYQDETTKQWINAVLGKGGPDSYVTIYETSEAVIKYQRKPKPGVL